MTEASTPTAPASGPAMSRLPSDDRLALRATKGDRRAFAAIFRRYHQRLYRYCLAIVGDSEDAQDALQNTMIKALRALPGEERRIELKPWLYRIAHNESIEVIRRRRDTRRLGPELAAPGSGLAEEAAVRERLRRLISDLDELPERQRGTLVMRELAGLDFAEIGTALGTSPAVARQTLYEARLSLRQMDEGREMSCEAVTKALSGATAASPAAATFVPICAAARVAAVSARKSQVASETSPRSRRCRRWPRRVAAGSARWPRRRRRTGGRAWRWSGQVVRRLGGAQKRGDRCDRRGNRSHRGRPGRPDPRRAAGRRRLAGDPGAAAGGCRFRGGAADPGGRGGGQRHSGVRRRGERCRPPWCLPGREGGESRRQDER